MSTTRPHGSLYTKITNSTGTITFAHPENNVLGAELVYRLREAFEKFSEDETIHSIILRSEDDRAFCTGISLQERAAIDTVSEATNFYKEIALLYIVIATTEKIVIGRVQGKTIGEGIGLLAVCDYVFATDGASLQLPELDLNIIPVLGSSFVIDKMGKAGFMELSLTPTGWKNAYWGKEKGLFAVVFDSISEMDKELDFFTTKLASCNRAALYGIKKANAGHFENLHTLLTERAEILGKQLLSNSVQETLSKIKKA